MTEPMKKRFKLQQCGSFGCRRCKARRTGQYVVYQGKATPAVDGTKAFRIFFVCHEKGHITDVGYTKPVDFNKNFGTPEAVADDYSYEEDLMIEEEQLMRELSTGVPDKIHKRFY